MKSVLVAEDNATNRELIREILELLDYRVIEAVNGQEALDQIAQARPDLVLLDIQMPVLDGYAIIQRLREDPKYAGLEVIALTAYAMAGDRERALAAGFNDYISKPINIPDFIQSVRQALQRTA